MGNLSFRLLRRLPLSLAMLLAMLLALHPGTVLAYKEGDVSGGVLTPSTHQWIIDKAIMLLESSDRGRITRFPVKSYVPYLHWGAWYADNTEVKCIWKGFREESCDSIHHYANIGDIAAWKTGTPKTTIANTGEFSATFYSQMLFDQAVRFWPGGIAPKLADLPYKDAGSIRASFIVTGVTDLGNTYVGGQPLCEKNAYLEKGTSVISVNECPKWPQWAAIDPDAKIANESVEVSLRYLGWAVHIVEDLTVPYHANNQAIEAHPAYETDIQKDIENGVFDHLPIVGSAGAYKYLPCGVCAEGVFEFPVVDNFQKSSLSIEQLAKKGSQIASATDDGAALLPNAKAYWDNYDIMSRKAVMERGLDAAIKLVAAVLEKYFLAIALDQDPFEPNDTFASASSLGSGRYAKLTIDTPNDTDWYIIGIPADHSDLVIDLYFDHAAPLLTSRVVHGTDLYAGVPAPTSYGARIELRGIRKGDYFLQTYSPDQIMVAYDLHVIRNIGSGILPRDTYEDNDTPAQAAKFYNGCDYTGDLTIDQAGDDDYYYVNTTIGTRVDAKVMVDNSANMQMMLDGKPSAASIEQDGSTSLTSSLCATGPRSMVRISGQPSTYSMCILSKTDPECMPFISRFYGMCILSKTDPECMPFISRFFLKNNN